jgi:Secretion system C-terminal sorting domain
MKKIIIGLFFATTIATKAQSVDPGIGALNITDASNVNLAANSLVAGSTILLIVPVQNLNETNAVSNGKVSIKLGASLTPDATYSLATAPLSSYFNWAYNASAKTIEGTLISNFPADNYGIDAVFKLVVATSGSGKVESNFAATPDENPINNNSTLNYNIVSSPLPVTLIEFNGLKIAANHNKLTWITAKEKDFDYFEIQKGADAKVFEGIGKVQGIQTQNSYLQQYKFEDTQANNAINYYRLKMVDNDGSFKYSNIISLQNEVGKSVVGEFYPNPADTYVQIDIISQSESEWKFTTSDLSGRVLKTNSEMLKKGGNKLNISIANWASGISIVSFENVKEGISVSRKIIKQ